MEFLKEFLGEDLFNQVAEKLKGNDKIKLVNIADGGYVENSVYDAEIKKAKNDYLFAAPGECGMPQGGKIASAGYVHADKERAYESVRKSLIMTRGKVFRNNKVIKTDTFKPKGLLSNPVTLTECYDCIIE